MIRPHRAGHTSKESEMFLFESLTWQQGLMWFVVLGALIGLNEVTRRWKIGGLAIFVALPIILTIFVWPTTAAAGSSTGSWFHWVKVYRSEERRVGKALGEQRKE